ncbi:MAG: class I SAM-dependent methyltransferase [Alphaproteobacteria bacterium]
MLRRVPGNVSLHLGRFEDTLPPFLTAHQGPVAFANIDCDLYSSTKTVFDALAPRIGAGTILAFDEYFNYHNWQQHEFKAFEEFVGANGVRYQNLGFTPRAVARSCCASWKSGAPLDPYRRPHDSAVWHQGMKPGHGGEGDAKP